MDRSWRAAVTTLCGATLLVLLLLLPVAAGALPPQYPAGWSISPGGVLLLGDYTSDAGLCKGPSGFVFEAASGRSTAGGYEARVSKVSVATGAVAGHWAYPAVPDTRAFIPKAIARDAKGNIVVAMQDQAASGWMVAKFSPAGVLLWDRPYAVGADRSPAVICFDSTGAVIVAGQAGVSAESGQDGLVVKWTAAGVFKWAQVVKGSGAVIDYLWSASTDANGNVYACGMLGSAPLAKAVVRSYSPAGKQRWSVTVAQATRSARFTSLVVKGASLYVTGDCHGSVDGGLLAAKYTLGGKRLWGGVKMLRYPHGAAANDLAVDRTNAMVIVGEAEEIGATSVDTPIIWKVSPLGRSAWHREVAVPRSSNGGFRAVALDSKDRIYAAGGANVPQPFNGMLAMRYSAAGAAQAMWAPHAAASGYGELLSVVVASDSQVVVSGIFEAGVRNAILYRAKTTR